MSFSTKIITLLIISYCLSNCKETSKTDSQIVPTENSSPKTNPSLLKKPHKESKSEEGEQLQVPNIKKKKTKTIDTLKAIKAIP